MGNATVFFRVFDIAFFAPGLVVLVPLWRWWDLDLGRTGGNDVLNAAVGAALWFLVAYGVGLVIQGITRKLLSVLGKVEPDDRDEPIWLEKLSPTKREELTLYFWYMRAACLNIAVAIPIAVLLWLAMRSEWIIGREGVGALGALFSGWVLWWLGRRFEVSWRRARLLPPIAPTAAGAPKADGAPKAPVG